MSSPAQSPRATDDVEADAPTPEEPENEQQQPEGETMNRDDGGRDFDFEVKEQDRWLPIANGELWHLASPRINFDWLPTRAAPVVPCFVRAALCDLHARRMLCVQALLICPHITPAIRAGQHTYGESELPLPACDLQPLTSRRRLANRHVSLTPAVVASAATATLPGCEGAA